MTDKLDDLLNEFDGKKTQEKEQHANFLEEQKAKKEVFNSSFGIIMNKIIRPTMTQHLKKIREHGHTALIDTDKSKHFAYIHENYLINRGKGGNYVLISIVGNHDHQKVFIYIEFSDKSTSKKSENKYDLSEITADLLLDITTNAVGQLLK